MAISFLWALYLTASLILFATLHKSDGSLAANGANVCSRSQRYSIKKTHYFCFLRRRRRSAWLARCLSVCFLSQDWTLFSVRFPHYILRCFDTVFRRPYRCFSIALKMFLSLSDRYKLCTSDWLWNEVCQNAVFSKIDMTMTTINKKTSKSIKS